MGDSRSPDAAPRSRRSRPSPRHRGAHPDDPRLFSRVVAASLKVAGDELAWLLSRGYNVNAALNLVGRHHQLEARQRVALFRAVCSDDARSARALHLVPLSALAGQTVLVDGLNVVITLEVALSGGVLLRGRDDTLRDLAGVRRNYHLVSETDAAIELMAAALRGAGVDKTRVLIDAPVSNSGRLRERFEAFAPAFGGRLAVELVPQADRALAGARHVASSDAGVIDSAKSWINLSRAAVAQSVQNAWIVDLG